MERPGVVNTLIAMNEHEHERNVLCFPQIVFELMSLYFIRIAVTEGKY